MGDKNNKREFTRVAVQVPVEVQAEGHVLLGVITGNVSMKGLLLKTEETLAEGTPCTLRIPLVAGIAEIRAEARVVRVYPGAMAFQYTRIIGTESFEHLRQLVIYNAPDAEQVEGEFQAHTGIRPKG